MRKNHFRNLLFIMLMLTFIFAVGTAVPAYASVEAEDISEVRLKLAGYAKGFLDIPGYEPECFRITGAKVDGCTEEEEETGIYLLFGDVELLNLDPNTPVTVVRCGKTDEDGNPLTADSEEKVFTFTRARTPELVPVQPSVIGGMGTIPISDMFYQFVSKEKADQTGTDPDEYPWETIDDELTVDPGSYYIRVMAEYYENEEDGTSALASAVQLITINEFTPAKEETPNLTFNAEEYDEGYLGGLSEEDDIYNIYDIYDIRYTKKDGEGSEYTLTDNKLKLFHMAPGEVSVVRRGNGTTTVDSDPQKIVITRAEKPALTGTASTSAEGNGCIDTTEAHEYTREYDSDFPQNSYWTDCNGAMGNLLEGTYYVRVKASGTVLASEAQKIVIEGPEREETPQAKFSATGDFKGTLSELTAGVTYVLRVNGTDKEFTPTGTTYDLTDLSTGKIKLAKKGSQEAGTVNSYPQEFTLTRAVKPNLTFSDAVMNVTKGRIFTDSTHEYTMGALPGADTEWMPCYGTLENLNAGTYYVRVKASGTQFSSSYQIIRLKEIDAWKMIFDLQGHGEAIDPLYVEKGRSAKAPAAPEETGYTFGGWFKYPDCSDSDAWNFDMVLSKDTTLYAKWTINKYTTHFDKNNAQASGTMADQNREYDDGAAITAYGFHAPAGYKFKEWNTKADGSGTAYADGATGNLTTENGVVITLYAQWAEDWGDLAEADIQILKAAGKTAEEVEDKIWIGVISPVTFTGADITLTPDQLHVYDGRKLLSIDQDYTVKYANRKNVCGAAETNAPTVTVTGKGNYDKTAVSSTFTILQKSLGDKDITWTVKDAQFKEGKVQKVKPVIKYGKITLKEGTDYEITAYAPAEPVGPGAVKITVTGKGNYTGTFAERNKPSYHIFTPAMDLSKAVIRIAEDANLTYPGVGGKVHPGISVSLNGNVLLPVDIDKRVRNFNVAYTNNDKVGTATVTITGINNYCGSKSATYKITPKPATANNAGIRILGETVYTGKQLKPAIDVYDKDKDKPIPASNYTVTYKTSTNVSDRPVVTVKFKGNYSGTMTGTFAILPRTLNEDDLDISVPDVKIKKDTDPVNVKPVVKYGKTTLVKEKDYDLTLDLEPDPNEYGWLKIAKVRVGGNYRMPAGVESFDTLFRVYKETDDLEDQAFVVTLDEDVFIYDGTKHTPKVTVEACAFYAPPYSIGGKYPLREGQDYTVTYSNNINVPAANAPDNKLPTVTIKGKGAYKGKKTVIYDIVPADLAAMGDAVSVSIPNLKWTGKALKPKTTVTLNGKALKPADFQVTFTDLTTQACEATATITGQGNYKGQITQNFYVYKDDISKMTFDKIADQIYTGAQIRPGENNTAAPDGVCLPEDIAGDAVRIYTDKTKKAALYLGRDYTLEWGVNVKTGNGTVTVKGIGPAYGSSKTLTFKIKPKAVKR